MRGSLRAYAAHRKKLGLRGGNLSAVQKAIKNQRISVGSDGKIDFDGADRGWADNSDQTKVRGAHSGGQSVVAGENQPELVGVGDAGTFAEAQRRREWLRVQKDELELARKRAELAPIGEINAFVAGMIVRARDILTRIGPELKDRLAQETDPHKCERLIVTETTRALNELAEFKPTA